MGWKKPTSHLRHNHRPAGVSTDLLAAPGPSVGAENQRYPTVHRLVITSSRSFALAHLSNNAPTCFRVPRSGSIIGTRTSDSRPTSKITEDVDDLLDEIDSVLEENAEEFVRGYVQKGGQ